MKNIKIIIAIVAIGFISTACNRVKCPTDTFSKDKVIEQNSIESKRS